MTDRRSLTAAVKTPVPGADAELVRSFVTQNQPDERQVSASTKLPEEVRPLHRNAQTNSDAGESKSHRQKSRRASRFQPVGLIPVTVRLRPEIAGALKRASLERELEGEEIFTQQDLVEQVLEPWLRSEGLIP